MILYSCKHSFFICCLFSVLYIASLEKTQQTNPLTSADSLLYVSTLDGSFHGVSKVTGEIQWTLKEDPVLKIPADDESGPAFLPDPKDGSLYAFGADFEGLKKLPFTIPELVTASPCRSSDGTLYTGSKRDVWLAVDPITGIKSQVLTLDGAEKVCPSSTGSSVFIGRTEYTVVMYNSKTRAKRWNVTFMEYSSQSAPELANYELRHFASSSTGMVLTLDNDGEVMWAQNYKAPIVGIYTMDLDEGLRKAPFVSLASETLEHVTGPMPSIEVRNKFLEHTRKQTFYPTLYIGEYENGVIYALPAYVDEDTVFITPKNKAPKMLEGPDMPADVTGGQESQPPPSTKQSIRDHAVTPGILLLGYHEIPDKSLANIILDPSRQLTQSSLVIDVNDTDNRATGSPNKNPLKPGSGKHDQTLVERDTKATTYEEKDYLSGDVKFGIVAALLVGLVIFVGVLLPRVHINFII